MASILQLVPLECASRGAERMAEDLQQGLVQACRPRRMEGVHRCQVAGWQKSSFKGVHEGSPCKCRCRLRLVGKQSRGVDSGSKYLKDHEENTRQVLYLI